MGFFKPALFLISTHALVPALLYGANTLFSHIPPQFKIPGTLGLISLVLLIFFLYTSQFRPKHVEKSVYFPMILMFFVTCFDTADLADVYLGPKAVFLTHYSQCGDPVSKNVWTEVLGYLGTALFHPFHYIILYRMFNGLTWRSLELFNVAGWTAMTPLSALPLLFPIYAQLGQEQNMSRLIYPFILIDFYLLKMTLELPRVNNLGKIGNGKQTQGQNHHETTGFFSSIHFKLISFALTLTTLAIILCQIVMAYNAQLISGPVELAGPSSSSTVNRNHRYGAGSSICSGFDAEFWRKNNPILFFQPVKGLMAFGLLHLLSYAVFIVPILLINLIYVFRRSGPLPSFLWDLNVFSAGFVYIVQGYFLLGPLYHLTPKEFQVDSSNIKFWALNLVPFVTCLVNILVLVPFRRRIVGGGVSKKIK